MMLLLGTELSHSCMDVLATGSAKLPFSLTNPNHKALPYMSQGCSLHITGQLPKRHSYMLQGCSVRTTSQGRPSTPRAILYAFQGGSLYVTAACHNTSSLCTTA